MESDDALWARHTKEKLERPHAWTTVAGNPRTEIIMMPVPGMSPARCVEAAQRAGYEARVVTRTQCTCASLEFLAWDLTRAWCRCPVVEWVCYSRGKVVG